MAGISAEVHRRSLLVLAAAVGALRMADQPHTHALHSTLQLLASEMMEAKVFGTGPFWTPANRL
jgi:hypothetical protein